MFMKQLTDTQTWQLAGTISLRAVASKDKLQFQHVFRQISTIITWYTCTSHSASGKTPYISSKHCDTHTHARTRTRTRTHTHDNTDKNPSWHACPQYSKKFSWKWYSLYPKLATFYTQSYIVHACSYLLGTNSTLTFDLIYTLRVILQKS